MYNTPRNSENSAFTLIELLVVIAIIGILMSLLFPAVNSAIDAAKKAQAKNDVTQIATAVIAYETEYGKLPYTNFTVQDVGGDWLAALGGSNAGTPSLNPRQIVFIELPNAKGGKKGVTNGTWYDPWGAKYQAVFDSDYDNTIPTAGDSAGITGASLKKKIAVWNKVSDMSSNNVSASQQKRRAVVSWE
jgi:prepilin-type N-terminal cleavage/methylation domain-containing protein